jgi:hypothetical protein
LWNAFWWWIQHLFPLNKNSLNKKDKIKIKRISWQINLKNNLICIFYPF